MSDRVALARQELARRELERRSSLTQTPAQADREPVGLPGYSRTEKLISERPDRMKELKEELLYTPKTPVEALLKQPTTGLKALGALWQRGEGALANVGMQAQEEDIPTGRRILEATIPPLAALRYSKSALKGLTGERKGELGDIPRRAGVPEPVSAGIGLFSSMGVGGISSKGRQVINKASEEISSRIPSIMGKNYTMQRAEKTVETLNNIRTKLGQDVNTAISKVADISVDTAKLNKNLPVLPKNVANALDDPVYGIEKLSDGSFKPSIGNLQKMKYALDDFMTSKSWEEAGKETQKVISRAYGAISGAMKEAAPNLKEPMRLYGEFMGHYRNVIKTVKDTSGNILEKKLRGTFVKGAERRSQIAWEELSKKSKDLQRIMNDIKKYNNRQNIKGLLGKGAMIYGGYEAGRRLITEPLLKGIGKD